MPGASAYELQIARDAAFTEIVLQTRTTVAGYRWEQLPTRTHWWRVRSVDAESRPSEWSAPKTVAVDTAIPTPLKPADGAVVSCGATASFEMETSPLIREYVLELSPSADFSSVRTSRSTTGTFEVPNLSAGTWFWRTRAVDVKQRTTEAGPVRSVSIRVGAPKVKPLADLVIGTSQVTFTWAPAGCAKSYIVEVSAEGREKVSMTTSATSLPFKLSGAGEYRWRVASVDERGSSGELSPESVFRVRLPTPVGLNERVEGTVLLSWAGVSSAVGYELELERMADDKAVPLATHFVSGTTFPFPDLTPNEYRWRVAAKDAQGRTSAPADWRYFVRSAGAPLSTPRWGGPLDESVVSPESRVTLRWERSTEANAWEAEVDGEPHRVGEPQFETAALEEGTHRFRVRAFGAGFRVSQWSQPVKIFAGRPSVDRAEIAQQGDQVIVELYDAKERTVRDVTPQFTVEHGQLSEPTLTEKGWRMTWTAPPLGDDVLHVDERSFHTTQPLIAVLDAWGSFAIRAGGIFNGGSVRSPDVGLGLGLRLPFLRRRIGLELRGAVYESHTSFSTAGVTFEAQAWLIPISLTVSFNQRIGPWGFHGGVGPVLQVAAFDLAGTSFTEARPGFEIALAASRVLGPGRLELELGFLWSRFDTDLARLNAGGFTVRLGYVFELFGGR